jgi:7-cyano-7-deazaguanine synthase
MEHKIMRLRQLGSDLLSSTLTDKKRKVPEGHYAEESMKATVVPARNLIMASVAIGWCASLKYDAVALGVHAGDHAIYPDCRPEFIGALDKVARLADWHPVKIMAPYLSMTKKHIAVRAKALDVPLEWTWTCYKGGKTPCGKCGSCVERKEALQCIE